MHAAFHITARGDNRQDIHNNYKKTLTEIEVQTVTFIEAKNDFADWVCDLVWEASGLPFLKKSGERALFDSMNGV